MLVTLIEVEALVAWDMGCMTSSRAVISEIRHWVEELLNGVSKC